ncbi:anthranilate phosphoribosyltransferase [Planctomicrobium piriforme]|uniref:Anthranilate phosphoribosyltransferase n=1 Tax=Planctomicrobium piriforme TaxID=1576369 RepID=A0A1I3G5F0_9PLAN|nr:anthranilate phosphoribosyltransferase [Planctomicrobium piriforme]SFI18696.1 anthranilate phosphoribosyltransferase [Planctomicrobium piriforme]
MQQELRIALDHLLHGQSLDSATVQRAIGAIMDERCGDIETAALLTALAMKGETEEELAGAASAMRERATRIPSSRTNLLDTCGTGGDRMQTFNISTAAAFVIAAAGIPVAKHGNRSVSSSSGSADVLEALGVNIGLSAAEAGQCLDDVGICFCYARTFHTAMKHVAPVRQQLGFRTIFNLLGPLTNPANAQYQLIGVSTNATAAKIAGAVSRLNLKRAIVVCGNNQLDEVSLWGTTQVWDVTPGEIQQFAWNASHFGLPECSPEDLKITSKDDSAQVIRNILDGRPGPARNIVIANAAIALLCSGAVDTPAAGVQKAAEAIDQGRAAAILTKLVAWTNSSQS